MATLKTIEFVLGEAPAEAEKLLLKISRNEQAWLSPIGWKDYETSTLLPYQESEGTVSVFFSDDVSTGLKDTDALTITSFELGFEQTLIWETVKKIDSSERPKKNEKSGGLLSKLTHGSKTEIESQPALTEAERRVADAQRATEDYKAKMKAATAAQAEATRRAKEAARQAEEALRLEAERAAEMERAAKALEEAERFKHEELRRVEEERRLEEERLAEEARRIEAARQRQLAAKREAERQAALKRFSTALDVTQNESRDTHKRLSNLRTKAQSLVTEQQQKSAQISKIKEKLKLSSETVETRLAKFEEKQTNLDSLTNAHSELQEEADRLKSERQKLTTELTQAEIEYSQAQKLVEEAVARAEAKRIALESKRRKDNEILDLIGETSEKLGHQSRLVSEASVKTQDMKAKLETAQSQLSHSKLENETLTQEKLVLEESLRSLEYDMEIAQTSLEDLDKREAEYARAITHLEAGGSADDVEATLSLHSTPLSNEPELVALEKPLSKDLDKKSDSAAATPLLSRPATKLSFPVKTSSMKSSFLAGVTQNIKQGLGHKSTFMTLAVLLGGVALIGGSYVTYQNMSSQSLVLRNDVPTPEDVASAVTEIEPVQIEPLIMPESDTLNEEIQEIKSEVISPKDISISEKIEESKSDTSEAPIRLDEAGHQQEVEETKDAEKKPVKKETNLAEEASLSVVSPTPKPETVSEEIVKTAALEITQDFVSTPVLETDVENALNTPATASQSESESNYPELTLDVQSKLTELGFYYGTQDGQLSDETKTAISEFKNLYDLPGNSDISGAFLNQLNKSVSERQAALKMAVLAPTPTNEITPLADTVPIEDVAPSPIIILEPTPESDIALPGSEDGTETEKLAETMVSIPESKTEAMPQDIIVEAELQNELKSFYPRKAERNNIWINNVVVVEYDIGTDGKPTNIQIVETEYDGRYASAFENAAIKTISKARYSPKTVNGEVVVSEGNQKRIVFRGE